MTKKEKAELRTALRQLMGDGRDYEDGLLTVARLAGMRLPGIEAARAATKSITLQELMSEDNWQVVEESDGVTKSVFAGRTE